jgi:hypothetical protein
MILPRLFETRNKERVMAEMQPVGNTDHAAMDELMLAERHGVLCDSDVDEYFRNIKEELKQVDRLVSDAVNNLVINFRYISKLTKSHHDMVLAIEKMAAPEGDKQIVELLDKQMTIADKIEQELETVVTSLQFGDLVTQLLMHTDRQVEMLNNELHRFGRQGGLGNAIGKEGISSAINAAKAKSKRKPVVQQGMQMGDIELF